MNNEQKKILQEQWKKKWIKIYIKEMQRPTLLASPESLLSAEETLPLNKPAINPLQLETLISLAKASRNIILTQGMQKELLIEKEEPLRIVASNLVKIGKIIATTPKAMVTSHVESIALEKIKSIGTEKIRENSDMATLISFGNPTAYAAFAKESKEEQENIKTKILNLLENVVTAAQQSLNKLNDLIAKEKPSISYFLFFRPSRPVPGANNENDTHHSKRKLLLKPL
jgi:hypothetical protein